MSDEYPLQSARSRRFTVGAPSHHAVVADGATVLFLRSPGPDDALQSLWALDVASGEERLVADAAVLLGDTAEELPPEERARRERARESGSGIVAYATDGAGDRAVFTLSGRLFRVEVATGEVHEVAAAPGVYDPRLSPDGGRIAYVAGGDLHVVDLREADGDDTVVAFDPEDAVRFGVADFAAHEEMGRSRGYWWSPDGTAILAARVDESTVKRWFLSDPAHPAVEGAMIRYPAAGTANAEVTLHLLVLDGDDAGASSEVIWDRETYPYLARVGWSAAHAPLLLVQTRDQRRAQVLNVDTTSSTTQFVREVVGEPWIELADGWPARLADGRLVTLEDVDRDGTLTRSVLVDGEPVSPAGTQIRDIVTVEGDTIDWHAWNGPTDVVVQRWSDAAIEDVSAVTGLNGGVSSAGTSLIIASDFAGPARREVVRDGRHVATIATFAEDPGLDVDVRMLELGPDALSAGLLLPRDGGTGPLPVVLSPYGGPGSTAQRVQRCRAKFLANRWLADQGFAVLVVDGSGMSGRGPAWEHRIRGDFARTLDDQVTALHAAAELEPRLDLTRVGMRGWSFGGYLSALAVLRRPDVFRAAVAGAPVTDWRLYDTHYTERYLGHPEKASGAYRRSSLVDDAGLVDAADWGDDPPALMIVHGLADDNVVAAHSLALSHALLAAGRPHRFLPLSGVSHMTPQAVVSENLLRLELAFLRETLQG